MRWVCTGVVKMPITLTRSVSRSASAADNIFSLQAERELDIIPKNTLETYRNFRPP